MSWAAGKVVIITGASSGIGAATARAFAKLRSHLVITDRNDTRLQQVAAECVQLGTPPDKMVTCLADVEKEEDVRKVYTVAAENFNTIDVLFPNAGYGRPGPMLTVPLADLDSMYNLFVRGVLLLSQLAFPKLKESKGCIVNCSSVVSTKVCASTGAYSVCKAAMDGMSRQLALEWAEHGIRVNSVNPGFTNTNIFVSSGLMNNEEYDKFRQDQAVHYPLGRNCEADEVAELVVFLASPQASFITGQNHIIDGGNSIVFNL